MKTPEPNLSVWVGDGAVWVKVDGRANIASSVDFKTLVNSLWQQGHHQFVLDLTDCLLMDSTFLGVLAGLGIKLGSSTSATKPAITLLNASARIRDLLENLGVTHLFALCCNSACQAGGAYEKPNCVNPSPEQLACTSLEAHRELMTINPDNVPKFKEVARFLEEDLKRMQEREAVKAPG